MPTLTDGGHGRASGLVDVLDDPVGLRERVQRRPHPPTGPCRRTTQDGSLLSDDHPIPTFFGFDGLQLLATPVSRRYAAAAHQNLTIRSELHFAPGKQMLSAENEELKKQIRMLQRRIAELTRRRSAPSLT